MFKLVGHQRDEPTALPGSNRDIAWGISSDQDIAESS